MVHVGNINRENAEKMIQLSKKRRQLAKERPQEKKVEKITK